MHNPGFDCTLSPDCRQRVRAHEAAQRLLDTSLAACKAQGWLKARGTQRTDSTHVLAALRTPQRWACVLAARPWAWNQRSHVAPAWVQQHVPLAWSPRYGLRPDQPRLPKEARKREAMARQVGAAGYQLFEGVRTAGPALGLRERPALEARRRIWRQQYDRCPVPGLEPLRWRTSDGQPPAAGRVASPYDLEARYRSQRDTHRVGDRVHLPETCEAGPPDLLTQVMTTPAATRDRVMGPALHQDLANRELLPGTHVLDSGSVDADLLVTAQTRHQIDGIGPPFGAYRRQRRAGQGDDLQAFVMAGAAQQAPAPQGHTSGHWRPGQEVSGDPALRRRFEGATCRAGPPRLACTSARGAPRHLTVRLQTQRRSRPRGNARRPRRSPRSLCDGQGWSAAARKARDASICAGVGTLAERARTSSTS